MKRRNFLGFLGGAAAFGGTAAKSAAQLTVADLHVGGAPSGMSLSASSLAGQPADAKSWAKEGLKRLAGLTNEEREWRKRQTSVYSIDPDIASMRSVSLVNRLRISKDRQFERSLEMERVRLLGQVAGFNW